MISVRADLALVVVLVGLLSTLTSCARHTIQTQSYRPGEVKPSAMTDGTTSTPELVPMSAPGATEPKAPAPTTETTATTVRPSADADDPRAVIDWLLDGSRHAR